MFDEGTLRGGGFAGGVPITLGDGREWYLPKPVLMVFFPVIEDERVRLGAQGSFGPEYDALIERLDDAEGFAAQLTAAFDVAVDLLSRNYDLKPEHYRRLLPFRPGDEDNGRMWQQIIAVARGFDPGTDGEFGPKGRSPAGSGST
jgi:hypothetical protein